MLLKCRPSTVHIISGPTYTTWKEDIDITVAKWEYRYYKYLYFVHDRQKTEIHISFCLSVSFIRLFFYKFKLCNGVGTLQVVKYTIHKAS